MTPIHLYYCIFDRDSISGLNIASYRSFQLEKKPSSNFEPHRFQNLFLSVRGPSKTPFNSHPPRNKMGWGEEEDLRNSVLHFFFRLQGKEKEPSCKTAIIWRASTKYFSCIWFNITPQLKISFNSRFFYFFKFEVAFLNGHSSGLFSFDQRRRERTETFTPHCHA